MKSNFSTSTLHERDPLSIEDLILNSLREDIGDGDHSSLACIPPDAAGRAQLLVKESGIIAGIELAERIFKYVDINFKINVLIKDGETIQPGDVALLVEGKILNILKTERLVLNCIQRMSGIASYTNKLVQLIDGTKAKLLDTRKTSPGLRTLEKWAVRIGGGHNHRFGLYDMIMLKDNHVDYAGGIKEAIAATQVYLRDANKKLRIEVEARNLMEVEEILQVGGINRIMLDNFTISETHAALKLINHHYETEASGGITELNIREYAATGIDFISVGALTHNIKSLDLSLKAIK